MEEEVDICDTFPFRSGLPLPAPSGVAMVASRMVERGTKPLANQLSWEDMEKPMAFGNAA